MGSIAATSLTAGLVLLFAATIDRFESLKGLGVEAKTRQLDQKIEQADEALRRLKELAELTGTALVDMSSKMGRWDSAPTTREAYALAQKVKSIMAALGSDQSTMREALKPWAMVVCRDLANKINQPLHAAVQEKVQELVLKRSAIPQILDDPQFKQITAEITGANIYLHRLIQPLELDDYPDRFLQPYMDIPLLEAEAAELLRTSALQFAPVMLEIRKNLKLDNPERWFLEIEKLDKR